jgi:hypothetical protein
MPGGRKALVVATYAYSDGGLKRLAAPEHDAESFASVLEDPAIAGFDVTMLVNQPHYVVGEAIADFYTGCRSDDLTLLYFTGHGLKDDEGRLYLAMTNTRREALMFTAISGAQLNDAMDASRSRRKVLILDCCYSGAFPAGRSAKADEGVQTLERFQGKGRAVLTASDATQYAFEGDDLRGSGASSVFTRYLVEAISSGAADLDEDGDIALDELYSYVYEKVVAEMPQQRPKKQEDVDGRILIARNVHWRLPAHLQHALESPIAAQRLSAVDELGHLHRAGNDVVRTTVFRHIGTLAADDSRSVSAAATALLERLDPAATPAVEPPPALQASAQPLAAHRGHVQRVPVQRDVPVSAPPGPPPSLPEPPPVAQPPSPPGPSADTAGAGRAQRQGFPVPLVLLLIIVGGALQLLSRFLVFESSYGHLAADAGLATPPWVLAVGLPLVAAGELLRVRGTEPWALALSGGLVAGAALCQLDQALAYTSYLLSPDVGDTPGPGFWAAVLGTVVLLACAVMVLSGPVFRARPRLLREWRAPVATLLVLGALTVRLDVFADVSYWFTRNEPAILLAAACLPLTLLRLNRPQRWLGLTAVTIFGPWVCAAHVYALSYQSFPLDSTAAVVGIVTALVSVAACWLAQLGPRGASQPVGGGRRPHD